MNIEKLLRSMVGAFDADMQVKAMIASCFIRDGADLLEVFSMGWGSDRNNLSYRSKLFVNLRMAVECSLKGLVIVHSEETESPEDAYQAARRPGHSLAKLLATVQARSKWTKSYFRKASDTDIAQVDEMKVGLRYEVDMAAEFSKETFEEQILDSGLMSGTIGSDKWMMSLLNHAHYIGKKARKAFKQKLHDHTGHVSVDAEKRSKRIKLLMTNVGLL